ncbi:hypothetical protein FA13DRAFT_1907360 [Coprinellus micaceus]|uniref:Uncharacterized protein n=1 Tax=Coprinellus micaceus TaxID=71717 RepID=A0A4Y7SSR0_COPMI|nr:hypothetical protein FA13DRAFT_1907360 [Coprinellus micaceus]
MFSSQRDLESRSFTIVFDLRNKTRSLRWLYNLNALPLPIGITPPATSPSEQPPHQLARNTIHNYNLKSDLDPYLSVPMSYLLRMRRSTQGSSELNPIPRDRPKASPINNEEEEDSPMRLLLRRAPPTPRTTKKTTDLSAMPFPSLRPVRWLEVAESSPTTSVSPACTPTQRPHSPTSICAEDEVPEIARPNLVPLRLLAAYLTTFETENEMALVVPSRTIRLDVQLHTDRVHRPARPPPDTSRSGSITESPRPCLPLRNVSLTNSPQSTPEVPLLLEDTIESLLPRRLPPDVRPNPGPNSTFDSLARISPCPSTLQTGNPVRACYTPFGPQASLVPHWRRRRGVRAGDAGGRAGVFGFVAVAQRRGGQRGVDVNETWNGNGDGDGNENGNGMGFVEAERRGARVEQPREGGEGAEGGEGEVEVEIEIGVEGTTKPCAGRRGRRRRRRAERGDVAPPAAVAEPNPSTTFLPTSTWGFDCSFLFSLPLVHGYSLPFSSSYPSRPFEANSTRNRTLHLDPWDYDVGELDEFQLHAVVLAAEGVRCDGIDE